MYGTLRSYLAAGLALLTCPCHLVIVLPVLLTLTAGTALYTFLTAHVLWIYGLSAGLFLINLGLAVHWWPTEEEEAACCATKTGLDEQPAETLFLEHARQGQEG